MTRIDRYKKELRSTFDWAALWADTSTNVVDGPDGDVGMAFIGTVFALTPSGKFYTPWACSNVEPCRRCGGEGTVTNHKGDYHRHAVLTSMARTLRVEAMAEFGMFANGGWPEPVVDRLDYLDAEIEATAPRRECSWCKGLGSHEAAQDEDWYAALEAVAEEWGLYVTAGEGDPCDIFVCRGLSPEEE